MKPDTTQSVLIQQVLWGIRDPDRGGIRVPCLVAQNHPKNSHCDQFISVT